jgi:hypothetical protein
LPKLKDFGGFGGNDRASGFALLKCQTGHERIQEQIAEECGKAAKRQGSPRP